MHAKDLLDRLKDLGITLPFIIATGQGDELVAVEMMKRGALDYLIKDNNFLEFCLPLFSRTLSQLNQQKRLQFTEAALSRSEHRFQTLVDSAPVGIFETDLQGNCLFVNRKWLELNGLTQKTPLAKAGFNLFPRRIIPRLRKLATSRRSRQRIS